MEKNWRNLKLNINDVPKKIWVSRVEASKHVKGRAYVTFDNHRFDDNSPYVYVTENYGETWKNITSNLPKDYSVYVIKEDPINPNLLFVGTEKSVYFSYDRGLSWGKLGSQLPTVAIHDLVIHPRDGDLIAGTHGRSIWILDDINPLRNLTADNKNKLFDTRESTQWIKINTGRKQPYFEFRGKNPPYGAIINFFSNSNKKGEISISNLAETNFYSKEINMIKGINRFIWPFTLERNENEFNNYKLKFIDLVKLLQNIAIDKENLEKFDFNNKKSFREINLLRKNLLDKYGMYAGGEKIFGDKIYKNFNISPGKYKITITLENQEVFSDIIIVREDPIKSIN